MTDFRDVMNARTEADSARMSVESYGGAIEDGRDPDPALAVLLSVAAICLELRALGNAIDYNGGTK